MPRLYVLSGPDLGKSFDVEDGATLGRGAECTVHLRDASVSRHHARLERAEGGWRIVDTESRNGVSLGGKRVPGAALADGDEFQLGEVLLRFRSEVAAARAEPTAGAGEIARAGDPEEIALEQDPVGTIPPPGAPSARVHVHSATSLERTALSASPPSTTVQRGPRILQYHRVPDRAGFFAADLAQLPVWIRIGTWLLAIAVFAGLFVLAFKGTMYMKERAAGGPVEVEGHGAR
jgi:predicted component of type VI protein secretion system